MPMRTATDRLRDELIALRATQAAETYTYDPAIEQRIKAVIATIAQLAQRRAYAKAHRDLMFDLNGHHGRA